MAYIYKITNDINNKIQVGKTEYSIDKRFKEHCRDSRKKQCENRPLYRAINKYGIEHFHIELVEETDIPEEREVYWIKYFNSYFDGYNATLGGDGKVTLDYDLVIDTYQKLQNVTLTANELNIASSTVTYILKGKNIPIVSSSEISRQKTSKMVNQYNLNGEYIQTFPSMMAAAAALGKITDKSKNGASGHIADVCKGKRKSAYGFKWAWANNENGEYASG